MRTFLLSSNQKPPIVMAAAKEVSSSEIGALTDIAGIESINIDECCAVSGGPQISNRPPA